MLPPPTYQDRTLDSIFDLFKKEKPIFAFKRSFRKIKKDYEKNNPPISNLCFHRQRIYLLVWK